MRMNTRLDAPVHNRYRVACSSFKGYLGASFTCIKDDVPMDKSTSKMIQLQGRGNALMSGDSAVFRLLG